MVACLYHTTTEILTLISALSCTTTLVRNTTADGNDLTVAMVNAAEPLKSSANDKVRVFLTFSIHGREYLSSEVAYSFLSRLCSSDSRTAQLLDHVAFAVVPVLNPSGRGRTDTDAASKNTRIEEQRCTDRRKNHNNVDLNRNFDQHWDASQGASHGVQSADDYPGTAAMSEVETWTVHRLAEDWQPHMTIDLHTGTLAMYTPWNYQSSSVGGADADAMEKLLLAVRGATYSDGASIWDASASDGVKWQKPAAGVGAIISYLASGTLSDYLYRPPFAEAGAMRYSFIWEMYGLEVGSNELWVDEEAQTDAASNGTRSAKLPRGGGPSFAAARASFNNLRAGRSAPARQLERRLLPQALSSDATEWKDDSCFVYFNPVTSASLRHWMGAWTEALFVASERLAVDQGHAAFTGSREPIGACSL